MSEYFREEFREREPLPGKRILLVGDREIRNFEALRDFANNHSAVQLGDLIVPGAELDNDIISAVDYLGDMRSAGTAQVYKEKGKAEKKYGAVRFHFTSRNGVDFDYRHAPYEASRLKEEKYRYEYCSRLVRMAQNARPDLIFLSNFKIILHPVFVKAFEGKIVNVHPSVLPMLKGFRPEYRADRGEDPEASGYTIHMVDTDLDGGPTIFHQRVPLEQRNLEEEARLGQKEYEKKREEAHRLKIIQAQARWSPQVLALVASDTPRKIVKGDEAFLAEGRPNFSQTESYQSLLKKEYQESRKKSEKHDQTFDDWKKNQKPYSRVLFNKGNGWQTAEAILGAPPESNETGPDIITRYLFKIPGDYEIAQARWVRLLQLADKIREKRGMGGGLKTGYMSSAGEDGKYSNAYIELPYDVQNEFRSLIDAEMADVTLELDTKPTRVLAPRKSFWPTDE